MEKSHSHSVGCQVPLLIVSFALHSFLVYYNFNLSTVAFVVYGLGGHSQKNIIAPDIALALPLLGLISSVFTSLNT